MGHEPRQKTAALFSLLLYLGIFMLSSLPGSALPANIPDIIPHFCEYAVLAFFFIQITTDPLHLRAMAIALAWLVLLGLLDELHQAFVPGRFCSSKDLLVDTIGSICGLAAYLALRRWSARARARKIDQE
jgi:VanZ family protein